MKSFDTSIVKQFKLATIRAEELDKKLSEKLNELQTIKVALRDCKVHNNDLIVKLKNLESQKPAQNGSAPPQGQKYSYEDLLQRYESLKYAFKKVDESKAELEKQVAEGRKETEKKTAEIDALFQDNASVYERMEEIT